MASTLSEAESTYIISACYQWSIALSVLIFHLLPTGDILKNEKEFVFRFGNNLANIREFQSETISEAWNSENDYFILDLVRSL
jgi:hypothetical protein